MNFREFRITKSGRTQVWKIAIDGERYVTEHGILDGKMQVFSDTPTDKGKVGTKAYVSAADNLVFHVNREIRKKIESGYVEFVNGKPVQEQITEVKFDQYLPKNFCGYKPQTSISDSALNSLHKSGNALYTKKYDGLCHIAVHHTFGWEIYSRRMDVSSERFPEQIKQLESSKFDVGTILIMEAVCQRQDLSDDFVAISRFCRSDPPKARKLVEDKEVPEPTFIIFDILFHNGKDLSDTKYKDRRDIWMSVVDELNAGLTEEQQLIKYIECFDLTPSIWEDFTKEKGWEGFVVVDKNAIPGSKFYSFDGSAKRPKGHYKLKPVYTEDVAVFAATVGTGKRLGTIGALFVKQRHPETGEWFSCGKVGSGFTDECIAELDRICRDNNIPIVEKDKFANDIDLSRTDNLCVVELEYSERQPGTQKFRFPVFLRIRDDKSADECFAQRLSQDNNEGDE